MLFRSFKEFNLKKNLSLKKKLNKILNKKNSVIESLGKNYKNSYDKKFLNKYKKSFNFRVIGMGGSILGTQAIYDFLRHKIKRKFEFINNLDSSLKNKIQKKYTNLIVSKSGNTIETITNVNLFVKKKDRNIFITENKKSYLDNVTDVIRKNKIEKLYFFEPADKAFKEQLYAFLETKNLDYEELHNPMFILQKGEFKDLMDGKRLFMADFYKKMRKKLNILMSDDKPIGGKWSFDEENRKKLPKNLYIPKIPKIKDSIYKEEIKNIIMENFSNHPGGLDGMKIPCNRNEAKKWLKSFLEIGRAHV